MTTNEQCPFCGLSVNPFDSATWKEVTGWVGGAKKDSMRLRTNTERFAHDHCIGKLMQGQAPDQVDLLGEDESAIIVQTDDLAIEDIFNE